MKKILITMLAALLIFGAVTVTAGAYFGSGVAVLAEEVTVVKTALTGHKVRFSDSDIKRALGVADFDSITVRTLPSSTEGSLLLAGRRVKENQTIKRKNLGALAFVASSDAVKEASFTVSVSGMASDNPIKCIVRFSDSINYAPEAPDESAAAALTTQERIPVYGKMEATDPEGDELRFIVVDFPDGGILTLLDASTGNYKYTPIDGFMGADSFTYVATDTFGNWSEPVRVSLTTTKRMSESVFNDMTERAEYNAAVAMSAIGVMDGVTVGDGKYFLPDEGVTKAEFVSMAMKAYGVSKNHSLRMSFFDDNADIPTPLVGYVATAQRMGIIDGDLTSEGLLFNPNDTIKLHEAATIMSRMMGFGGSDEDTEYIGNETVPIYARAHVGAMCSLGILDDDLEEVNGEEPISRAAAAELLYRMIKR